MQDRMVNAEQEFREALRLDSGYLNARYNLARALAASGDLDGAAAEYSSFLEKQPSDADAHAALGTIQFKQQKYPEALAHFREAARLNPQNADVQANLGTLLAIAGDLPAAAQAFENALRLNPDQKAARANLERVRAQMITRH
jgi:Flp pilus assembly protein TadD